MIDEMREVLSQLSISVHARRRNPEPDAFEVIIILDEPRSKMNWNGAHERALRRA